MVKTDDDNIFEDEVEEVEEAVEEEVVESTPSPVSDSDYYAVWTPEVVDDYPPEVSEFNIIGYNSEGISVGPFKVMAPTLDKACVLVGIDRSRGPAQIVE